MIRQVSYRLTHTTPEAMLGCTFTKVRQGMADHYLEDTITKQIFPARADQTQTDTVLFYNTRGPVFVLAHRQACCETCEIVDICGDLSNLENSPLLRAEARQQLSEDNPETGTWTFFEFATIKGSVTITFLGESNGWYNEDADVLQINNPTGVM